MDFILEIPNNLSDELCDEMIKRFEEDEDKTPGVVGGGSESSKPIVSSIKTSLDLGISGKDGWKDIDTILKNKLSEGLRKYDDHLSKLFGGSPLTPAFSSKTCRDSGYQIQRTDKGGYYSWHSDSLTRDTRFLTFVWYLSSHCSFTEGGGTGFHPSVGGGKIVSPEKGKLLIFPATWTYIHAGLPFFGDGAKYICTGWMHSDNA